MMCERCEDLEEEVRFLKRELGITRSEEAEDRFCVVFGLTPKPAQMLGMLYRRRGAAVTKNAAYDAIYATDADGPGVQNIDVSVAKIRKALPANSVATVWARGYQLTATGLAACDAAVALAGEEIEQLRPIRLIGSKFDGSRGYLPILTALACGPKSTRQLQEVVPEIRSSASAIANSLAHLGLVERLSVTGKSRSTVIIWGITPKGLAKLDKSAARLSLVPEIAA
jgi:DNA-binding MarR family transcriptional regulator